MLLFMFLAFVASFACYQVARDRFQIISAANLGGSFSVWASIFSLGAVLAPTSGPWASGFEGDGVDPTPYFVALKFLAFAVCFYAWGYLAQLAVKRGHGKLFSAASMLAAAPLFAYIWLGS